LFFTRAWKCPHCAREKMCAAFPVVKSLEFLNYRGQHMCTILVACWLQRHDHVVGNRPFSGPMKFVLNFMSINNLLLEQLFIRIFWSPNFDSWPFWLVNTKFTTKCAKFKRLLILAWKGVKHIVNKNTIRVKHIVNKNTIKVLRAPPISLKCDKYLLFFQFKYFVNGYLRFQEPTISCAPCTEKVTSILAFSNEINPNLSFFESWQFPADF
jgi:hypothetical protein